jgi:hypothetical protein
MRRVGKLLDLEGPLCECWNTVQLALKHEQYVRAGDGSDLRTEFSTDVTDEVDAIVARSTTGVEKLLALVCAAAYDFKKQRDRLSCIKLQDQEQQVTVRYEPPSKKAMHIPGHIPRANGGGGDGSSVVDKNNKTGMSGAHGAADDGSSAAAGYSSQGAVLVVLVPLLVSLILLLLLLNVLNQRCWRMRMR